MARSIIRHTAAAVGVTGIAVLAGCSTATGTTSEGATTASSSTTSSASSSSSSAGSYTAGTYEAEGSYLNPNGNVQAVKVALTIEADGTIDAVEVTSEANDGQSKQYQSQFIDGISAEVVGKPIDGLSVSKVSGSSLTSQGFNAAVSDIAAQAAA